MATNTPAPAAPEKPADFQKQVKDVEGWIRYWRRRFKPQDGSAAFSPAMMNQQKQLQKQNLDVLKQLLQNQTQKSQVVFVKNEYNHEKLDPTEIKKRMEFDRSVSTELNNLLDDIRGSLFDVNSEVEFDTRLNHIREEKLENLLELQRQLTEIKTEDELSGPYLKQIAGSIARINATLKETQDALIKKQNLGQANQPKINITLGNSEPFPTSPNAMAGYSMANASDDSLGLMGAAAMTFVFLRHFSEMAKGIGKKFSLSNKLAAFGSAKLFTNTGKMLDGMANIMKSIPAALGGFPTFKKWGAEIAKKISQSSVIKGIIARKAPILKVLGVAGAGAAGYGAYANITNFSEYLDETFDPEKSKSPLVKLLFLDQVKAVKLFGNDGEALNQMLKVFTLTKGLLFSEEIGKAIKKGYIDRRVAKKLFRDKAFIKGFSKPTLKKIWQTLRGTRDYAAEAFEASNIQNFKNKINDQIAELKRKRLRTVPFSRDRLNINKQIRLKENILNNLDKRLKTSKAFLKKFYDDNKLTVNKTTPPKGLLAKLGSCCKFIGKALKKIPWLNGGFLIYEYIRYVRQNPKNIIEGLETGKGGTEFYKRFPDLEGTGIKEKILRNMALVYEWWLTDLKVQLGILAVNLASTALGPVGFLTVGAVTTLADILFTKFRDWKLGFKMADCDFDNPLTFINPKEIIKYKGIAYAQKQNIKIDQDVLDEAYGDAGVIVIDAETKNIDFKSNKISLSSDDFSLSWWKLSYFAKTQAEKLANFSTYALVKYLTIDEEMGFLDYLDFKHRVISFERSIDLGEYSFTLPGLYEDFLYSETQFASADWKFFKISGQDFLKKLMSSFGALRFLIVLFEDGKYLNSLFSYPGLKLGFTRMAGLTSYSVEATSYDYLKIFNVTAQIPIPKKLKEWLPRAIFAFYCASVFAYGKTRVFTDKESEKDKIFADNEKLIYAVAKYFIKDYEKLIPLLKERAKTDFSKDSDGVVTLDFKNIKDTDIAKTGNISTVEKTATNVSAESLAIFEASKDFIEKVEKASPEEKRKLRRDNIAAHVAQKLHETYGGFSFGYLIPALTEHVIMKYNFNDLNTKKDIENAVNKAIEDLKKIFPDNKTFGEASKTFLSFDESKTFFNNNETFKISTENLKLLTSYYENISNYKNVIPKDSSAANISKPNTTPDSAPYQDPGPSSAPSVSPNETEMIGAAPEIKVPDNGIWIQGRYGQINVLKNKSSNGFCARGVKTILNKMFNVPYFNGHAWQVPNDPRFKENFTEIQKPSKFQNGDVYVIGTYENNPYGHIAVFLNGGWYSDFVQGPLINVYRHSKKRPLTDAKQESLTKYYRPKKYLNGAPTVKISGIPSSSYNTSVSKPESNASEYEGKLNGNENQKENKAETVVVKGQEKKDSQPVNTHGMAEELFLIKIDNLGFVC